MGQDADAIRHDIELTRERMSERADALAYKADVPARTKDRVREKKDNLMSAVTGRVQDVKESIVGAKDSVADSVSGAKDSVTSATPDRDQLASQARRAKGLAETNPLGLAIGSIALGFLAGLLVPTTRIEDERLGPAADELKAKVKDLGQEALEHGKQVASDVAQAAKETAQESGQEHVSDLKDSATDQMGSSSDDSFTSSDDSTSSSSGQSWSDSPTAGRSNNF